MVKESRKDIVRRKLKVAFMQDARFSSFRFDVAMAAIRLERKKNKFSPWLTPEEYVLYTIYNNSPSVCDKIKSTFNSKLSYHRAMIDKYEEMIATALRLRDEIEKEYERVNHLVPAEEDDLPF